LNKRLWTSSFVLFNGGLSLLALTFCFWLLDLRKTSSPLAYLCLVFGLNSLAAYIFSEFLASLLGAIHLPGSSMTLQSWLYHPLAATIPNPYVAAFTYAMCFTAFCFLPVLVLYKKRLFLRL